MSMSKIIWSSTLWLLYNSTCPPIDTRAAHTNNNKENIINLPKGVAPSAHTNNN